jgi:NADH-quinone oxidoreductase subunit J
MESFLFWLWSVSGVFSGYQVISSNNPIMSVFWLILAFLNAAFLLLLLGLEFLPILFCIVYGGAIGIMFLFVVMLLNIKLVEINENATRYLPIGMIIGFIFLYQIYFALSVGTYEASWEMVYYTGLVESSNIEQLGAVLYTDYFIYFLVSSLVLLVSMIGGIVLCLYHEEGIKRQDLFGQVATEFDKTVVNYNVQ